MKLAIQVKNLGEDSFESLVKVQLPEGVSYINVLKVKSVSPLTLYVTFIHLMVWITGEACWPWLQIYKPKITEKYL